MANIPKLNYSFTDNQTTISAEHLNAFVNRINLLIDAVDEQPTPTQAVATPTISISGSTATISCSTSGATIRYTTNGNNPTTSSGTVIASGGAVTLQSACTVKAIAYKDGMTTSQVASEEYSPSLNKVYFDIHDWVDDAYVNTAGNVTSKVPIQGMSVLTILPLSVPSGVTAIKVTRPKLESDAPAMAACFYNGGQTGSALVSYVEYPTTASEKGTYEVATIQLPESTFDRLRMSFWKNKKADCQIYYETSESVEPTTPVAVSPAITIEGTTLTLAAQQGATIYYTLDNTTPTTSSHVYSSPVTLSENCTIKAIAVETGKTNSPITSRTYSV